MPMTGAGPDSRSESTGVLEGWAEGQRVIDEDGFRGTVRYIGPVATSKDAKAVWIGESQVWLAPHMYTTHESQS